MLLDAGNLLFAQDRQSELLQQDIITAKGIYEIYEQFGYQAIGVGPYDLTAGLAPLLELSGGVPWVSSNIVTKKGDYIFQPWLLIDLGQHTIAIIALTGAPRKMSDDYQLLDWRESLARVLAQISSDADVTILLSSLELNVNKQIAEHFTDIDLVFTANRRGGNRPPKLLGEALVSQVQSRGRYLGVLTVPTGKDYLKTAYQNPDGFRHRLIALHPSLEKSEPIDRKIVEIQKEISKVGKRAKFQPVRNTELELAPKAPGSTTLMSHESCVDCHQETVANWIRSPHGQSYQALLDKKQQYNLRCLPCHVTGPDNSAVPYSQETLLRKPDNRLLRLDADLLAVSCIACHRGAGLHAETNGELRYLEDVTAELCISCHSSERNPEFKFVEMTAQLPCKR